MPITTRIHTLLFGSLVGTDTFGNRYFEQRRVKKGARKKRWVLFKGLAEPSKVPAQWHGWLHYTHETPLTETKQYAWEKPHVPNLTGTKGAYVPPGHLLAQSRRAPATSDYSAWTPES